MLRFVDVLFDFPGHALVAHLVPAVVIYALGLYHVLRSLQLVRPVCGRGRKLRRKRMVAIYMGTCGGLYAAFYAVGALFSSSSSSRTDATLAAVGLCFFLAGALKFAFSCGSVHALSVDFSTFVGFSALALVILLHRGGGGDDLFFFNIVHYTFGIFLALAGLVDLLKQIAGEKPLLLLVGTLLVASAAVLAVAIDDVVRRFAKDGVDPLVTLCVLFAVGHVVALAAVASRVNLHYSSDDDDGFPMGPIRPYNPDGDAVVGGITPGRPKFTIVNSEDDADHA